MPSLFLPNPPSIFFQLLSKKRFLLKCFYLKPFSSGMPSEIIGVGTTQPGKRDLFTQPENSLSRCSYAPSRMQIKKDAFCTFKKNQKPLVPLRESTLHPKFSFQFFTTKSFFKKSIKNKPKLTQNLFPQNILLRR